MPTSKMWTSRNQWKIYSSCGGSDDHTLPPSRDDSGPVADVGKVKAICDGCRVRPECIKWLLDGNTPEEAKYYGTRTIDSVWVAGEWVDSDKRKGDKTRKLLTSRLQSEYERRGDDV